MPDNSPARPSVGAELSKERFAFASGNILASGLLVLNVWPVASAYQTGANFHFWTVNLPSEGVRSQYWVFWLLTGLLATGICAVLLASVHIVCRGLWLGSRSGIERAEDASSILQTLRRVGEITYGASFMLAALLLGLGILTLLVLLSGGVEQLLVHYFSFSDSAAGWISRLSVFALILALAAVAIWRLLSSLRSRANSPSRLPRTQVFTGKSSYLAAILLTMFWCLIIEFCYTVDLQLDGQILSKSRGDGARITIVLGGATSDSSLASLSLRARATGLSRTVFFTELDGGRYAALVPTPSLEVGSYDVVVEYPHISITGAFRFQRIRKTRGLIVLP